MERYSILNRRHFIAAGSGLLLGNRLLAAAPHSGEPILRAIPSTGEMLPVMGMGSSRTFDVGLDSGELSVLGEVMNAFFAGGGRVVDSSPMYGNAEAVLGEVLAKITNKQQLFAATKVWTDGHSEGIAQMQTSAELMRVPRFDLMQIHNLRDWRTQLATLRDWKEAGKIRYLGITTSHQRAHDELTQIMATEPLDFVQFSYSIDNRLAEQRLLPLAADRGIATLINRPFERGALFKNVSATPLPQLARDLHCNSWGQFFLKFIIGHRAVTCVIPATARLGHMEDNMAANFGAVPDPMQRQEMLKIYQAL